MEKTIEKRPENQATETPINEKPYEFRRLATEDIFPMLKLLNKIGLKDLKDNESIKNIIVMFTSADKKVDPSKLGIEIFLEIACLITDNIPKCEAELYAILSKTSNLTVEDIKKQDMAVTFEMILDFVRKEEFGDFFKVVLKLFK